MKLYHLELENMSAFNFSLWLIQFQFVVIITTIDMISTVATSGTVVVMTIMRIVTWKASGSCLVTPLAISLSSRRGLLAWMRPRAPERAPTGACCWSLY